MNKTTLNIDENLASLLCYAFGWLSGLILFLVEKENRRVRFHAAQAIIVFAPIHALYMVISWVPFLNSLLYAGAFILWLILMLTAYQNIKFDIPIAGELAEQLVNSDNNQDNG